MLRTYPLGMRGNVTVGIGRQALVCVADRDAATGYTIPGRFSRRIPIDAAALMPGGAEAAEVCTASLRAIQTHTLNSEGTRVQLLRVYPSCVISSGSQLYSDDQSVQEAETSAAAAATTSKVRVTFPAAALAGCTLRCRVNGRSLPISIVSAHRDTTTLSALGHAMEVVTLVVSITATGVDGVAMLELVRSSSHAGSGGPGLEQAPYPGSHLYPPDDPDNLSSGAHSTHISQDLSGVPVGLPAMPVLLVSDPEVHAALEEILGLKDEEKLQSDFGGHASTLCAVGEIVLRGTAPPRQAFQFACMVASKGQRGRALTRRVLDMYPVASMIMTENDAARFLLHAVASGDLETVFTALYCCQEAAESRGFDASELARFPVGANGETPLHRAAALHERGGDPDVMYELLTTLEEPMAWLMSSPKVPKLPDSELLVEAVGAAIATLVNILQRYPRGDTRATAPAAETIDEAISACCFPVVSTPYESIRSAMTLEVLSCRSSATRLLNIASAFNAGAAAATASPASMFSSLGHNDLLASSLSDTGPVYDFVAAACKRWPTLTPLTCTCAPMNTHVLGVSDSFWERFVRGVRRSGGYLPNGNASLFFEYNPELERSWMDSRTRTHIAIDHMVFMFMAVIQVVDLLKRIAPALWRSTDEQANRAMVCDFLYQLLRPCLCAALFFVFRMCPLWYSLNRETVIVGLRLFMMVFVLGSPEIFKQDDTSLSRKFLLYFTANFVTVCFPIRADRHLLCQVVNSVGLVVFGRGHSYAATKDQALRSSLAGASVVFTLMLEVQSRSAFSQEHEQTLASEKRRTEVPSRRGDWFKWGSGADYVNKPPNKDRVKHTGPKIKHM